MGHSTWSEEQKKLIELRLIEKKSFRAMRGKGVCKTVCYKLTDRGRAIAFNLACISKIIAPHKQSERLELQFVSGEDLERGIIESIEVALDSFGINLISLVKSNVEAEGIHQWKDVVHDPGQLITILRELFGQEGTKTVESMIIDNLKSRFGIESKELGMKNLICELKQKSSSGRLPQAIFNVEGSR